MLIKHAVYFIVLLYQDNIILWVSMFYIFKILYISYL